MNKRIFDIKKDEYKSFIYEGKEYAKLDFFANFQRLDENGNFDKDHDYCLAIDEELNMFKFKFPLKWNAEYEELDTDLSNPILLENIGKYEFQEDDA